jgi:hypothetical protein
VDFTAYAPGLLELPPIPLGDGEIRGIRVDIASVLGSGKDAMVLSDPALPLPVPGTMLLIYASATGFLLLLLGGIGGSLWARKNLGGLLEIWRKRRLLALMRKTERRLRRRLSGDAGDYPALLGLVSAEFRAFLAYITGHNCRAMTAGEFFTLPSLFPPELPATEELGGEYLGAFFRRLDHLRYSGDALEAGDVAAVLDGVRSFTDTLEKALRGDTK